MRTGEVLAIAHHRYRVEEFPAELLTMVDRPSTPDDGLLSLNETPGTPPIEES